jgi:DNA-directed RNA polymerase
MGGQAVRKGTIAGLLVDLEADTQELAWLGLRVALRGAVRAQVRHAGVSGPEGKMLKYGPACVMLGGYVEEHLAWKAAMASDEHKAYLRAVSKSLKKSTSEHHSRAVVRHVLRKQGVSLDWDDKLRMQLGGAILERIVDATGHIAKDRHGKGKNQYHTIRFSPELVEAVTEGHDGEILLCPFQLPMLMQPHDWTTTNDGGFETVGLTIMKQGWGGKLPASMEIQDMEETYRAINKLQGTSWRVNAELYAVLEASWAEGSTEGKLPGRDPMELPAKPWGEISNEEFKAYKEANQETVTDWKRQRAQTHEANARLVSKRLAMSSKLRQAQELLEEPEFYYVYTMDWRGRVYPSGADLTPQGDDSAKALLEFAEGKPIGDAGFYWLAVQLANTYGHDKVSNDDRVKWVLQNEERISESATDPLDSSSRPAWSGPQPGQ